MAYDARFGIEYKKKKSPKRKKSSRKSSKKKTTVPAVRHLKYQVTTPAAGATHQFYFDLFYHLSLVNRRLYRQGQNLFIKKITVNSRNTTNGSVAALAAPTSWVTYAAWRQAFKLWMEMRKGHGGAPGSGLPQGVTPATWADFKVYLSNEHRVGTAHWPLPLDGDNIPVVVTNAEWTHARYISPDATAASDEFEAHLLGPDVGAAGAYTSVGIIQGYEESRRTVQQDETSAEINTDSWMINLFDDGTTLDEIAEDLKDDGDFPPYQYNQYTGGATNMAHPIVQQHKSVVQEGPALSAPTATLGSVLAPCGLLQLDIQSNLADDVWDILIEIQEGPAKGVKALPM